MRNKFAKVSDPNTFFTNPGDKFHIVYSPKVMEDGTIELQESGKDDIQEMIDSWRETTDMSWIVQRIKEGDMSVLNQATPMYGDFTKLPETYAEALQLVINAENQFNQLPLDVRNSFDNDYKRWFAQAGTDTWFKAMESVFDHVDQELASDIKEGVSENES